MESTDRLIRLINDILDVERMSAGRLPMHRQEWSSAELITRAVGEMRALAAASNVSLEVRDAAGHVNADADRIVQTLTNLLSNAIQFSPQGGTVRIVATEREADVLFSVSDEGQGIPPDQLDYVFGRFSQVDASDTRGKQGTGLGLAICRGLVEQHGGRIWAENLPGAGAVFSFTLPSIEARSGDRVVPADDHRSVPTVLVCADDPQARAVMTEMLRSHGYRPVEAASSEEALASVADQSPAAVLMDLTLPGMDDWTTLSAIRADERTRDVPVVIVSGTEPGSAPTDVAAWLTKPLDVAALLSALNDAITNGRSRPCVLIVEDDPALTQVLAALFARHDVMALTAHTAQESMRLCREVAPDLLLLDLLLPDSDGFTLVDWFRQDPNLCRVPLVVYTALDLDESDRQRLRLGPTEFYTKARTNPEEVEQHVLNLLDSVVAGAGR
jgi:CheY-like chemotaxis protein/two-component sensor histidine kinase